MTHSNAITREQFLYNLAGSLSLTAALIHAMAMPEHFQEWWGYGLFFFGAAAAQAIYGVMLLFPVWNARSNWVTRLMQNHLCLFYLAGIVGNAAIIALYLVTRTSGIPVGPSAGEIETFSALSVTLKLLELALVASLTLLLAAARHQNAAAAAGSR